MLAEFTGVLLYVCVVYWTLLTTGLYLTVFVLLFDKCSFKLTAKDTSLVRSNPPPPCYFGRGQRLA